MKIQSQRYLQFNSLKFVSAIFLTALTSNLHGQYTITGKVNQSNKDNNQFTEVLLLDKDSVIVKNDLIAENGSFTLKADKAGNYTFKIKQLNNLVYNKRIQLNSNLDFGVIVLENTTGIKEVVINGKKKLVERKIDRLVFNVENAISTTGGDALEALKITPGVKVQNENVSIIGKGTVSIMVDDRLIQLKQDDLSNFLKSVSADNIKSIEVITTPPAKYDALGNSGIINIKTKTAKKDSWNANVGASYLQRSRADGSVFGNFNYNKNKLTLSASLNYRNGERYSTQDDYAYFPDALWYTASPYVVNYKRFGGKLGMDYQLTKNWTTGIQYILNANRVNFDGTVYTPVTTYDSNTEVRHLNTFKATRNKPVFNSVNYYNEIKLDSLGKKLTVNLDYFNFKNDDEKSYHGNSIINIPYSEQYFLGNNNNIQKVNNFSAKVDVEYPISFANLSFGGKLTHSKAENNIRFFNSGLVDNPVTSAPLADNLFEYTENVQALYISGNKKINDKWETKAGVRMESTQTEGNSLTLNKVTKNNYVKFFPTLYVTYKPNENNTFGFSYSKRIDRPTFNELNPNLYFENPFQSIEGNPFLQPAFIDNFEFTYTYKNIDSKIYFSNEKNLYGQIAIANPENNIIRFTNENYANTERFGIAEGYTFDKLKWWSSMNSLDVNYARSTSFIDVLQKKQEGWSGRLSTNNDFILNKDKTFIFNVNYWYNFAGVDGKFYKTGDMSNLSATIQYLMLDKNLRISLKVNDIFRTEKIKVNSVVNGVFQRGVYYNDNQSVQLTVTYKFGSQKVKSVRRATGNEEERNRTGN
ncbi:outer membrane beta-barrel family protein [uncultured Chryseobacterium sp.]|uniref:outer membrane beta-barrel family protein n=1 Tax=uncultured Chryseobacterium sp. TaxID=259322 RepID=UPI0025F40A56|nr:outer membrane beta-barrel family protein [uncultured Chryseobacterium sp.]